MVISSFKVNTESCNDLITKFYQSMEQPSLTYVQGRVDGKPFWLTTNAILEFLGVPNEPGIKYQNPVKDMYLTNLAYAFWQLMVTNVLPKVVI